MNKIISVLIYTFLLFIAIGCKKDEGNPTETPTTGTIVGKVSTATGDTAISAAIVSTNPPTSSVSTNSTGEYSIDKVSPGTYTVTAVKSAYFDASATIKVVAGNSTSAIIQMVRIIGQSGMIKGVVKNAAGDSLIAGATVVTSPPTSSVATNAFGEYSITNIPAGAYTITATKSGYTAGNAVVTVTVGQTTIGDIHMNVIINHAPNTPILISPSNGATSQALSLSLSWSCSDIDGDNLLYDLYLDKSTIPTTPISTNQSLTNYTATNLDLATTYYWRVVAKDSKGALSNSSSVNAFTTINLSSGLVAYYPFNSNANDESGHGNNLVVNGAVLTTDRFGNANKAYSFNGTNAYLSLGSFSGINSGNSVHTISGWIYISQLPPSTSRAWPLLFGSAGTNTSELWILGNEGTYAIGFYDISTLRTTATVGVWTHVCAAYDGSTVKGYINGQLVQTINASNWNLSGIPLTFAKAVGTDPAEKFFQGSMDDFRFYNRVLSQQEILALYNER